MKRKLRLFLAAAAVLVSGLVSIRQLVRRPQPAELPVVTKSAGPGPSVASARSPEEIFRRAFWRHPTAPGRIAQADRREGSDRNQAVQRWPWFLQVRPSAALLGTLREGSRQRPLRLRCRPRLRATRHPSRPPVNLIFTP